MSCSLRSPYFRYFVLKPPLMIQSNRSSCLSVLLLWHPCCQDCFCFGGPFSSRKLYHGIAEHLERAVVTDAQNLALFGNDVLQDENDGSNYFKEADLNSSFSMDSEKPRQKKDGNKMSGLRGS